MNKKTIIIISALLILNIGLTLLSIFNARVNHARTCTMISAVSDSVMTKLDGTVYDKGTVGMFNHCLGYSFFLVRGF